MGKSYVLKQIDMQHMTNEQKLDSQNEAELINKLRHPHIVTCHKTFVRENKMNILLELCENGDLEKFLKFHTFRMFYAIIAGKVWSFI